MSDVSIAIVKSDFHGRHSGSWSDEWLLQCKEMGLKHELVDWRKAGSFEHLTDFDIVLWHYSHYSSDEMRFAAGMLEALSDSGCKVFPDYAESRHFDDKVIQSYVLKGLNIPAPSNYCLHSKIAVEEWANRVGCFPVVAKLRSGSGSNNVILIHNESELSKYSSTMFGKGISATPSPFLKIKSNVASSKNAKVFYNRLKRAPEFLFTLMQSIGGQKEKGYVYLQEFVPGVDYDLKIVVVGDKLSFIGRSVRKGDFRASGGGGIFYDKKLVSKTLIDSAFEAAKKLGSDCIGFDYIIDPATQKPLVLEMSYGFSHQALLSSGGYFDRDGNWYDEPLNVPKEIIKLMVDRVMGK